MILLLWAACLACAAAGISVDGFYAQIGFYSLAIMAGYCAIVGAIMGD